MANETITMEEMKRRSIKLYDGMKVVCPQLSEREETIDLASLSDLIPKFNGCYATNNSTVCFISDGEIWVTPSTLMVIRSLSEAGFTERYFYVPFSNGDYPKAEQEKWYNLMKIANHLHKREFEDVCEAFCDKHGIGSLGDDIIKNCFEMPAEGVMVKHHSFDDCYYPILNSDCLDCMAVDKIGKFCCNNGIVVFVYRNGKTYVKKGYKIVKKLEEAGYKKTGIFVPFSNGEQILDPFQEYLWESIKK